MVIGAQLSGAGQASHTARLSTELHQLSRQKFTLRDEPGSAAEDRGVLATLGRKALITRHVRPSCGACGGYDLPIVVLMRERGRSGPDTHNIDIDIDISNSAEQQRPGKGLPSGIHAIGLSRNPTTHFS
jgi:hypothetical protein